MTAFIQRRPTWPHDTTVLCAEHRITAWGHGENTDRPCERCADVEGLAYAENAARDARIAMRAALLAPDTMHTRYRPQFGGIVSAYRRDPSSPSGVMRVCGLDMRSFEALEAEMRAEGVFRSSLSPLSPTEGL